MELEELKNEISIYQKENSALKDANSSLKDEIITSFKENKLLNQKLTNLEKEMEKIINKRLSSSKQNIFFIFYLYLFLIL
jgi:hypothetical protein